MHTIFALRGLQRHGLQKVTQGGAEHILAYEIGIMSSAAGWPSQNNHAGAEVKNTSLHAGFAVCALHLGGLYKRKAGLNTTARLLGRKRACVENEQYEVGFAGIQHNRDDHENYAIVLPYDYFMY